jgi:hypothetical protein
MKMSSQKNVIPVTISIPPPPEYPIGAPDLKDSITDMKKNILLHTQQPIPFFSGDILNHNVLGDVKLTLDDLKTNVLGYFSALYKPYGVTIEEKIADLRKPYNFFESQFDVPNIFSTRRFPEVKVFQEPTNLHVNPLTMLPFEYSNYKKCYTTPGGLPNQSNEDSDKLQHHMPDTVPSSILDEKHTVIKPPSPVVSVPCPTVNTNIANNDNLSHHNFENCQIAWNPDYSSSPIATPCFSVSQRNAADSTYLTHTYLKDPTHYSNLDNVSLPIKDYNVKPIFIQDSAHNSFESMQQRKPCAASHITDLIQDVKDQVDKATHRLENISNMLDRETENPSLKSYSYTRCPRFKRRPRFGSQKEMEECMLQLYADLYSQVQWNERRIKALQQKIQVFQLNAASFVSTRNDPRDAS